MVGKVIAFAIDKVFQLNAAWIFTVQSFSANNLDVSFARTAGQLSPSASLLSNPADRERLGRWGEKRCERFLKKKGFKKLTRNFSCRSGEIDLIMADAEGAVVFVEVKTRADEDLAPAESAITSAKKTSMSRAARYFLATHNIENRPFRFDVVTIVLGQKGRPQIRHYENAFVP